MRLVLIYLLLPLVGYTQLNSKVVLINDALADIKAVDFTIQQSLSIEDKSTVVFTSTLIDKKGRKNPTSYLFDLEDVDLNAFKSGFERDLLKLEIHAINKEPRFAELKDGKVVGFVKRFKIDASDSDNVERLSKAFSEASNEAISVVAKDYNYTSLDQVINDLVTEVGMADGQSLVRNPEKENGFKLKLIKGKNLYEYEFKLTDIDLGEIRFVARGTDASVQLSTSGRQRTIKLYENGFSKDFVDRFLIDGVNLANAKRVLNLFRLAVDVARGANITETHVGSAESSSSAGINCPSPPKKEPFRKVMSSAFAKEYEDCPVTIEAEYFADGYIDGFMKPRKIQDMYFFQCVEVGGQGKSGLLQGGLSGEFFVIDKDRAEEIFALKKGEKVEFTGTTFTQKVWFNGKDINTFFIVSKVNKVK
ncbi:MAG: hypothetical protein H6603_10650 [Flavobacteriales bacterium]|nr:hypothetical protein [Flavobacteriales bacterium]